MNNNKLTLLKLVFISLMCTFSSLDVLADNPLVTHIRTADPSPLVYNGRFYIVVGRDEVNANGFNMYEWHLLSSSDMNNWTDHGAILRPSDISWMPDNSAWASQIVYHNNQFYFYASGDDQIGVLVSNTITGPYVDVNGAPMVDDSTPGAPPRSIDPMVYVDDDGTGYMFYGGDAQARYVELASDMTSLAGPVQDVPGLTSYLEAPFVIKENGTYFLMYATHPWPSEIRYATSSSIHGPWSHQGVVGSPTGTGTNHEGAAYFNGQWWYTYHNEILSQGNPYSRSVNVDTLTINGNTLEPVVYTSGSIALPTRMESYNYPGYYISHNDFNGVLEANSSPYEDTQFRVVPGLAGEGVSFESVNYPGYYLRHYDYVLYLHKNDSTVQFYQDATFNRVPGLADANRTSYQSYNFPDRYIRHYDFELRIDPIDSAIAEEDATFSEAQ